MSSESTERLSRLALEDSTSGRLTSSSASEASPSKGTGKVMGLIKKRAGKKGAPLIAAVQRKDVAAVRASLLSTKSNARDPLNKSTALMVCVAQSTGQPDDVEMASVLLSASGIDVDAQNQNGDTALMALAANTAACAASDVLTKMLLARNPDAMHRNASGASVFHIACEHNNAALLSALLAHRNYVGCASQNNLGETPIYVCCKRGYAQCLELMLRCTDAATKQSLMLVSLGCLCGSASPLVANVVCVSSQPSMAVKYSALHIAVIGHHTACVELLLADKQRHVSAFINAINLEGYTPLYLALELGDLATRNALLRVGGDPRVGKHHRHANNMLFFRDVFLPSHMEWLAVATKVDAAAAVADLSRCHLDMIPLPVFQMSWLRRLDVSGCLLEAIPRHVGDLASLESLLAHDNRLRSVSPEIFTLQKLCELRLDGNLKVSARAVAFAHVLLTCGNLLRLHPI